MRIPLILSFAVGVLGFSNSRAAVGKAWIERSNAIAKEYSLGDAERYPESASSLGYREFDAKAIQLEDDMESKDLAYNQKWRDRLKVEVRRASDADYRLDLQVLLDKIELAIESQRLEEKYGNIPFYKGTEYVFNELRELINDQASPERKRAGVDRFAAYVSGHGSFKPLLEAFQSRILAREKRHPVRQVRAMKQEVSRYLEESADYLKGIQELLQASGRSDWRELYARFGEQARVYDTFVKSRVLPKARTDYRLPAELYALNLRGRGIQAEPRELVKTALKDYAEVYTQFEAVAAQIAAKHELRDKHPAAVIRFLKTKSVTRPADVRRLYTEADTWLANLIREKDLLTLPTKPLVIRFAGDAESKANPVPHLRPPPLVDNRGERPEFVVPTSSTGQLPFDDFSYEAAALTLAAHEGRPGHDLQFSSMLDKGVSIIRARYAFNSVNAEGWGLYAEDIVYPYMPLEAQLVALQARLWRIARTFLDPQIQLGEIQPSRVLEVFTKELGVSEVMAGLEVRRYTTDDPGQAPSYYYGLLQLREAKAALQKKLGRKFSDKCFHDGVLSLGLLPIFRVSARLSETLVCLPAR